jgi:hypothetical protein
VPYPKRDGPARARLFLIVDDHSRLLADGRFCDRENARLCQELLRRAITRRGIPDILYCDYAEVDVKPENLNPACSGRALWQILRLNAAG